MGWTADYWPGTGPSRTGEYESDTTMRLNLKNVSFHWHGKTSEGVSRWSGSIQPLKMLGYGFTIYGPIAGIAGLGALVFGLATGRVIGPALPIMMVGLIHGLVFTSIGLWSLRMHRHVTGLAPAAKLAESLGLEGAALRDLASQRNIKPRIILNDEPYYDPTDFVDALSLLRGSAPLDTSQDDLMRPACAEPAPADGLLRATTEANLPPDAAAAYEVRSSTQKAGL